MKKFQIVWIIWVSLLLAGCENVATPNIDTPNINDSITDEQISESLPSPKESNYARSWHMDRPSLTEMDNRNDMIKWVSKDWSKNYQIMNSDIENIKYCNEDKISIYTDRDSWWIPQNLAMELEKSGIQAWQIITVNWTYKTDPLAKLTNNQQSILSKNWWLIAPATTLLSYSPISYGADVASMPCTLDEERVSIIDNIWWDIRKNKRYSYNTLLVTNDLLLHTYHKLFENSLKYYEETVARENLSLVSYNIKAEFDRLSMNEKNGELREIYEFLAAYWTIPNILLPTSDDLKIQWEFGLMQDISDEELDKLILERANIFAENFEKRHPKSKYASAILDTVQDILDATEYKWDDHLILAYSPDFIQDHMILQNYTNYQPRSHYTDSNALKTYFMASKRLMREKFYFGDENLVKAALVMVSQLDKWTLKEMWTLNQINQINDMISNLIWTDDDLTLNTLLEWEKNNSLTSPEEIITNLTQEKIDELSKLVPQKIASSQYLVDYTWQVSEIEWKSMTDWFVFFGEKFTLDAYLFDLNTAWSTQDEFEYKPNIQTALMVPDILEWSSLANELTKLRLETKNQEWLVKDSQLVAYDDVRNESIKKISQALQDSQITNNVYHKWLNALGRLISKVDENAPYFMQTRAYALKNLVTYLWSYTELKHDTLLYTKQPQMAELGWWWDWPCAIVVEAPDLPVPKWYIEADIDVIDELINLTKETSKYYDDTPYENLYKNFVQVLEKLKLMVLKQMKNEKISDSDFERLRQLDEILWDIVYPINADYSDVVTKELRWSIISDIFTSEKNNVLYEAIGRPALMYLMVKDINWARVVVWPVFTQYEFYTAESPINSDTRYTDLDWQWSYDQLVESGKLDSLSSLATQEMIKEMK